MAAPDDRMALPPARIPPVYLAGWALLGALAVVYLAVLALRPELAPPLNLQPPQGLPESNQSQRAMARAVADIGDLKSALERVESELKETRAATQQQERRSVALELRLSALETRLREAATPVAAASPAAVRGDSESRPGADRLAGSAVDGTVEGAADDIAAPSHRPPSSPPQFRTTTLQPQGADQPAAADASRAAAPARTGTANALTASTVASAGKSAPDNPAPDKPAPESKAVPEPKAPPLGLLIATGPSLDAVRLTWLLLQEGHKSTLKSLEPRYIEGAGDPPTYQLIAGPIGGREAARRACERLRAKQAHCSVIPYAGKSL